MEKRTIEVAVEESPVGYFEQIDEDVYEQCWPDEEGAFPLFRHPPTRKQLTIEEIGEVAKLAGCTEHDDGAMIVKLVREVERAHFIGDEYLEKVSYKRSVIEMKTNFFLKWSACIITVLGCLLTSLHIDPFNVVLGAVGAMAYMIWAVRIKEINLIIVNAVVFMIYVYGLFLRF